MKLQTKNCKLIYNQQMEAWVFYTQVPSNIVNDLSKLVKQDCVKTIEVKKKSEKRSLNANAYYWQLIHLVSQLNRSTDEETHVIMLERYGTKEYLATIEAAEPLLRKAYKIVDRLKPTMINDTKGYTYMCIRGSSTYDTKEMSILIEGLVSECKKLNIETMTPDEIKRMMENYKPVEVQDV